MSSIYFSPYQADKQRALWWQGQVDATKPIGSTYSHVFSWEYGENYDAEPGDPAMVKIFGIKMTLKVPGKKDIVVILEPWEKRTKEKALMTAFFKLFVRLERDEKEKRTQAAQHVRSSYLDFQNAVDQAKKRNEEELKTAEAASAPTPPAPQLTEDEELELLLNSQDTQFKRALTRAEKKKAADDKRAKANEMVKGFKNSRPQK
jgi:hypothetical protein